MLLNPMIILIIVSESTIECSSIILFVMVGRYTFLKFEKNNVNSIFKYVYAWIKRNLLG